MYVYPAWKIFFKLKSIISDATNRFTFTSSRPEYIWYDTTITPNTNSLKIDCEGEDSFGSSSGFSKQIYFNGLSKSAGSSYTIPAASANSGAYQCAFAMANSGANVMWVQKTSEVLIASKL